MKRIPNVLPVRTGVNTKAQKGLKVIFYPTKDGNKVLTFARNAYSATSKVNLEGELAYVRYIEHSIKKYCFYSRT